MSNCFKDSQLDYLSYPKETHSAWQTNAWRFYEKTPDDDATWCFDTRKCGLYFMSRGNEYLGFDKDVLEHSKFLANAKEVEILMFKLTRALRQFSKDCDYNVEDSKLFRKFLNELVETYLWGSTSFFGDKWNGYFNVLNFYTVKDKDKVQKCLIKNTDVLEALYILKSLIYEIFGDKELVLVLTNDDSYDDTGNSLFTVNILVDDIDGYNAAKLDDVLFDKMCERFNDIILHKVFVNVEFI